MTATLLQALAGHGADRAVFLPRERGASERLDHGTLHARALACAGAFHRQGVRAGTRVVLPFATDAPSLVAFLALLALGALPLSVKTAAAGGSAADYQAWLDALARRHGAAAIVAAPHAPAPAGVPRLAVPETAADPGDFVLHVPQDDEMAFVQFSSGTTGSPKGVPIQHGQLLQQLRLITGHDGRDRNDVGASWLPLYHDMGLVGGLLTPLWVGHDLHLWTPQRFLLDPVGWLETLAAHGVSVTALPNFGVAYLARRLHDDPPDFGGANLQRLRHIYLGSDMLHPAPLRALQQALAPAGLREEAFTPCYGMAEAVLMVTCAPGGAPRMALDGNGRTVPAVGRLLPGFHAEVVDADGHPLAEGRTGEIRLAGGTLGTRYFEAPAPFVDERGFYATGDLGFLADGWLHVCGRLGDEVKVNGQRVSLPGLEQALQEHPSVRPGGAAVVDAAEGLVALVEPLRPCGTEAGTALRRELAARLVALAGVRLPEENVRLVRRGQLPRTSSGKLQRRRLQEDLDRGAVNYL